MNLWCLMFCWHPHKNSHEDFGLCVYETIPKAFFVLIMMAGPSDNNVTPKTRTTNRNIVHPLVTRSLGMPYESEYFTSERDTSIINSSSSSSNHHDGTSHTSSRRERLLETINEVERLLSLNWEEDEALFGFNNSVQPRPNVPQQWASAVSVQYCIMPVTCCELWDNASSNFLRSFGCVCVCVSFVATLFFGGCLCRLFENKKKNPNSKNFCL